LVIGHHDLAYLAIAAAIWVLGAVAVRWLYRRTHDERGIHRGLWLWFRAVIGGANIWAVTVLACLAWNPGFDWSIQAWAVLAVLPVAIIAAVPSLFGRAPIAVRRPSVILGASSLAFAFAVVHFATIAEINAAAPLHWSAAWQAGGLAAVAVLIFASFIVRARGRAGSAAGSIALSLAGIGALHFLSFAGVSLEPARATAAAPAGPTTLIHAVAVVGIWMTLLGIACMASLLSRMGERKALQRLRTATNALPSAMALFDASDRLVVWNTVFERIMGPYASAVREGMPLSVLFEANPHAVEHFQGEGRPSHPVQVEFPVPGGVWIRVENIPTEDGGMLSIGTDITQWRQAQEALAAAVENAEAGSRAKSEFLATMSHEIRTPLNGVLGMAQALATERLTASQRAKLEVIQQGGETLLSVLNNILDLSKVEAGSLGLEDGVVDAGRIARTVQGIFSANATEKGIGLTVTVSPTAEGQWRGDPMRVQQILQNLVSNAVKFTESGGVAIKVGRLGDVLVLAVSDTGPGVTAAFEGRMFDAFTQADASTTRRFGGTGLGLSICRALVQLMGGEIELNSYPGKGATFTVRLPLERIAAPVDEKPAVADEPVQDLAGLRLLAAEDNVMNQVVLRALLEPFGVDPHMAATGEEALNAWEAGDWDVILMDVQMPEMDGPSATRRIRELERTRGLRRTPIIGLTANAMTHQTEEYLAHGMDQVVAKPYNIAELVRAIDRATRGADERTVRRTASRRRPRS
jgi:signal transduction histidine kinase/NO-binding membrane sensor protein with MHYT domain/ActR/RegA family two-component response regulator